MSAQVTVRFPCPACGSPLRLRERRFVGAKFPCPDCGIALTLDSLRDGEAAVRLAEPSPDLPPATEAVRRPSPKLQLSPTVIGWCVALLVGSVLLALMTLPRQPPAREIVVEPTSPTPDSSPSPEQPPPIVVELEPEPPIVPAAPLPERVMPQLERDETADPPVSALTAWPVLPLVLRPEAAAVLAQPLARFEQTKPTSRRELLTIVEDLIGRRIDIPEDASLVVTESATVAVVNGTVADVITQILSGTDWELALTTDTARLQRRTATTADGRAVIVPR